MKEEEKKPQTRFKDGMYVSIVEKVREMDSKTQGEEGYLLVSVLVNVSPSKQEKAVIALPLNANPHNKHGRFYSALYGKELNIGDTYDPENYVDMVFEAFWEWDGKKQRMKADKFLYHELA